MDPRKSSVPASRPSGLRITRSGRELYCPIDELGLELGVPVRMEDLQRDAETLGLAEHAPIELGHVGMAHEVMDADYPLTRWPVARGAGQDLLADVPAGELEVPPMALVGLGIDFGELGTRGYVPPPRSRKAECLHTWHLTNPHHT